MDAHLQGTQKAHPPSLPPLPGSDPPPRRKPAGRKPLPGIDERRSDEVLLRVVRAVFPQLNAWSNRLPDPRLQPRCRYTASPCRFYRAKVGLTVIYSLWLNHYAQAGSFSGGLTPSVNYPVNLHSYSAGFEIENAAPYPPANEVFFTGPVGSGLNHSPANPLNSSWDEEGAHYQSPVISSPPYPPGGTWTVEFKGSNYVFNLPDPQSTSRLVIPVPTFVVSGDVVQSVSWVYRNAATGAVLPAPPEFITGIQVQIEGYVGGRIYESPWSDFPAVTSHTLEQTIQWSNVSMVNMAYDDSLGNHYVIFFQK